MQLSARTTDKRRPPPISTRKHTQPRNQACVRHKQPKHATHANQAHAQLQTSTAQPSKHAHQHNCKASYMTATALVSRIGCIILLPMPAQYTARLHSQMRGIVAGIPSCAFAGYANAGPLRLHSSGQDCAQGCLPCHLSVPTLPRRNIQQGSPKAQQESSATFLLEAIYNRINRHCLYPSLTRRTAYSAAITATTGNKKTKGKAAPH